MGIGAECSVALKYLHTRKTICATFPNATAKSRLKDMLVIGTDVMKVNKRDQKCVLLRHDEFPNATLHRVVRWLKIEKEGPDSEFFEEQKGGEKETVNAPEASGSKEMSLESRMRMNH